MYTKKTVSMKAMVILLAVVLMIGCVAGGTLAYLMTKTEKVTNTFVAGAIGELELKETKGSQFTVIPGVDIDKDPVVTFKDNNVAAYVFLKVDANGWKVSGTDTTYTYSIGTNQEMKWVLDGWKKLDDGVYYKEVVANAGEQSWNVIKDDKITVSSEITKDNINTYTENLSFTAYAIQKDGFTTVTAAWNEAKNATN